jgi:CHAP domain
MSLEGALSSIAQIESAIADPMTLVAGATPAAAASTQASQASSAPTASAASFADVLQGASASGATQSLASVDALNSVYGISALDTLASDGASSSDGAAVDPAAQLLSLLGTGSLGSTSSTAALDSLTGASASGTLGADSSAGNQAIVRIAESQVGQIEQPFGSNDGPAIAMYRSAVAGAEPGEPWCAYFASWVAKQAGVPLGDAGQGFGAVADIWSWAQQTGRAITNGPGVEPQPGDLIVFGDQHVGIVTGVQPDGDIDTVEGNYDNQVVNNVRSPSEATGYVNMSE